MKDLFDFDTGSLETGISPWKFMGDESTLETEPCKSVGPELKTRRA